MKCLFLTTVMVVVAMIFFVFPASADNCDKPRDDFDGLYCLNKVYIVADADLNEAYKTLRTHLNKEEKSALKKSQIKWIKHRNSECSFHKDGNFWVNLKCAKETTIARTYFLSNRTRECKATGCQSSKLSLVTE